MASPQYLTPTQASEQLGLTVGHLAQLRYTGKGPAYVKLTARAIRYRQVDIDEWVGKALRRRTDDRPPAA